VLVGDLKGKAQGVSDSVVPAGEDGNPHDEFGTSHASHSVGIPHGKEELEYVSVGIVPDERRLEGLCPKFASDGAAVVAAHGLFGLQVIANGEDLRLGQLHVFGNGCRLENVSRSRRDGVSHGGI